MTNPNNAVGTNAAYGGRTSVNAFNDDLSAYSRGVLSGWACSPSSGLSVVIGGDGTERDVAIAEDDAGNKTTINNISKSPISVTVGAAPGANTRIDSIVAYVNASPQGTSTIIDNYEACGMIVVQGTASSSPVPPTDGVIRTAITADGASGATAYYVVIANITVASGTTDITAGEINAGDVAQITSGRLPSIGSSEIADNAITPNKIDFASLAVSDTRYSTANISDASMDVCSITIPTTGTYLIISNARVQNWSDGATSFLIGIINVNGTTLTSGIANPISRGTDYRAEYSVSISATLNANDVVTLDLHTNGGTATLRNHQTLAAIRIA